MIMKKGIVLTVAVFLLSIVFVFGCAKKTVLQEERTNAQEMAVMEQGEKAAQPEEKGAITEKAAKAAAQESAAKEAAAREAAAKEAAAKEAAAREAAAKEAAAREAAAKEAAAKEKAAGGGTVKEGAAKAAAAGEGAVKKGAAKATEAASAKDLYEFKDINYDFDKFNLRSDAREILEKHAEWLNKNKEVKIVIEGHCDERGTAEYNLALGERRASVAAKFLVDMGIVAKRIKTVSYGEEMPLDPGHNEEAWAKNRRAHFVVSTKK
jgi:peptidoglycan-associated lipoprotein